MHNIKASLSKKEGLQLEFSGWTLFCMTLLMLLLIMIGAAYMTATHVLPAVAELQQAGKAEAAAERAAELTEIETSIQDIRKDLEQSRDRIEAIGENLRGVREVLDYLFKPVNKDAPLTPTTDLRRMSGLTVAELDYLLEGTAIEGHGIDIFRAERLHGVNAWFLLALSAHESGWWSSRIFRDKNNAFGWGAYDHAPYESAIEFDNFGDGVMLVASRLSENYLTSDGQYYRGATPEGLNINYASDGEWAGKVVRVSRTLASRLK